MKPIRAHIPQSVWAAAQGVKSVRGLFFQAGAEERRWQALTLANSAVAALQHAMGDFPGADATTTAVRMRRSVQFHPCCIGTRDGPLPTPVALWQTVCSSSSLRTRCSQGSGRCSGSLQHSRAGRYLGAPQVRALSLHGSEVDVVDEERDKFIPSALKQIADLRASQVPLLAVGGVRI